MPNINGDRGNFMSNDFKKHIQLIENIDYSEDEFGIDPEETLTTGEDFGSENYDLDDELDREIASVDELEPNGYDDEYSPELDSEGDLEDVVGDDEPVYNYTATIQIHGYDFPMVLQSDDMDEIKTVMQVMRQSGLNPRGDYKWNSKTFQIDLDESSE